MCSGIPPTWKGCWPFRRDFHLALLEDAAESLGSTIQGRHTGTLGLMGTLSFNGNKTVTTGGGGALLTNDAALARRAKHLTTTAKMPHRWEYRPRRGRLQLSDAEHQCSPRLRAVGAVARVPRRQTPAVRALREGFCRHARGNLMAEPAGCRSNYWLQTLLLNPAVARSARCDSRGHQRRRIHDETGLDVDAQARSLSGCAEDAADVAESLEARLINIPSSAFLAAADGRMSMSAVLLVGAGGHARACIDVIETEGRFKIAGLVGRSEEVGRADSGLSRSRHATPILPSARPSMPTP